MVYQYGHNPPQMKITPERSEISIAKVVLPYVSLVDTKDLLDDGDILALSTVNGKYISCDSNNMLVAVGDAPNDGCTMIIKKDTQSNFFKIQCNNGKYVTVNAEAGLALYATGTVEDATTFSISISVSGGLRITTVEGLYIHFVSNDSSLRATSVDQFGACTIFNITLKQIDELSKYSARSLNACELAWAAFIWNLTGGFFLAIGLGPFISTGKVKPDVFGLIKSNPTAWKAIQDLMKAITDGLGNTGLLIASMLGVITVFYEENLLWKIFKKMMKRFIWLAVGWALAKIIEIIFLPEAEVAELLANFTIWGVQTVEAGLAVSEACN